MSEELKPCPFCGSEAKLDTCVNGYDTVPSCTNDECIAYEDLCCFDDNSEAIAAWNRRSDGWIRYEDQLLEEGEYLCSGHGKKRFICRWTGRMWLRQTASKQVFGITHYQPLPSAPKEEVL